MSTAHLVSTSTCEVNVCVCVCVSVSFISLLNFSVCLCKTFDRPAFKHKSGKSQMRQDRQVLINVFNNIKNNFSDNPVGWVAMQSGIATVVGSSLMLSVKAKVRSVCSEGATTNAELRCTSNNSMKAKHIFCKGFLGFIFHTPQFKCGTGIVQSV
jgi:hypothetical protein